MVDGQLIDSTFPEMVEIGVERIETEEQRPAAVSTRPVRVLATVIGIEALKPWPGIRLSRSGSCASVVLLRCHKL